jgi:hypothetical protein
VAVNGKISNDDDDVDECNIGTEEDPKYVKFSSSLTREQKAEYIELLREFDDVFSWTYEYLIVGQLRGGVNQLLPCLNNNSYFKLFAENLMTITIMQGSKQ